MNQYDTRMWVYLLLIGSSMGSFLNVLADRLPRDESVVYARSKCESCRHVLAWYDLIPIFSYVVLRGRCRYCRQPFSWQYVAVEITTALIYLSVWLFFPLTSFFELAYILGILSCLLVIVLSDIRYHIIPDEMLIALIGVTSLRYVFSPLSDIFPFVSFQDGVTGALMTGGAFLLLVLITKGKGMGLGDVKYAAWMGYLLGVSASIVACYTAFLTGAMVSLILVGVKGKSLKSSIAFGPFLVLGTLIAWGWADNLWYLFWWYMAYTS